MAMRAHETDVSTPDILLTPGVVEVNLSTFPTGDGKPMAENFVNGLQMTGLQDSLRRLLEAQERTNAAIGGNQFLYYNPYNKRDNLSPDAYVALDVDPGARDVWFTWEEGKAPDIVFEITSPSTRRKDLSTEPRGKLTLYGRMGVREYYVYDPALKRTRTPRPRLYAFTLQGKGMQTWRLEETALLPDGGVWSPLLRAELRPVVTPDTEWEPAGVYLRVIDPETGAPIRVGEEIRQDYQAAREQAQAAREQAQAAREQAQAARERVMGLQEQLTREEMARQDAEQRARRAEEELERLRAARAQAENL